MALDELLARPEPLVIAHRGGVLSEPGVEENSLEAFERAIAGGADLIEFDVRRTADGALVVFHDAEVDGRAVSELSRDQLAEAAGLLPPLLREVVELTSGRGLLDVELKEDGYVEEALGIVTAGHAPGDVLLTSFVDEVVLEAKRLHPEMKTGLLLGIDKPDRYLPTRWAELFPLSRAGRVGADFLAPYVTLTRLGVLRRGAGAGLRSLPWTIDEDQQLERLLADERVAGVITDAPQRAMELRRSLSSSG